MSKVKSMPPGQKLIIVAVIIAGAWFGFSYLKGTDYGKNILTAKDVKQTQEIQSHQVILPDAPKNIQGQNVQLAEMPSSDPTSLNVRPIVIEPMAWNSQMGMMLANGGQTTTKGSIMEKKGVKLVIKRQDNCDQMQQNLIKFAESYKSNPSGAEGTNFVAIMGDGAAAFLASLNTQLEKLGTEYRAKIIYSMGKSLGEDKFMAPQIVKDNPQNARGLVCSAYLRDGDWNIVVKWCADNGIPVNTDEKTYDPDAMNFVASADFIDAAQKYVTGFKEDRLVVETKNGVTKKTGDKKTVEVNCTTTWTPGDVIVAENKGGLVSIVSTAEYRSQMPNVMIGIDKYMQDNKPQIEAFLMALAEGGDQVKTYDAALNKAGEISAKVWGEKDGVYWVKYYKGTQQADKTGAIVSLGGSRVHNLADNLELFGLSEGSTNVYASVYKVFGDIVTRLYPELVPNYPAFADVTDFTYLNDIKAKSGSNITQADKITYKSDGDLRNIVAKRAWKIEFETGSANFTTTAQGVLEDLYNQLTVASGVSVEIFGHTDNVGNPDNNLTLSQSRAAAVKNWLQNRSKTSFPESRFARVFGKGQNEPVADNNTNAGRSKNRRVEIVMGN